MLHVHASDLPADLRASVLQFYGSIRKELLSSKSSKGADGGGSDGRDAEGEGLLGIFSQSSSALNFEWLNPVGWFSLPSEDEPEPPPAAPPPPPPRVVSPPPTRAEELALARSLRVSLSTEARARILQKLERHREALRRIMERKNAVMEASGLKLSPVRDSAHRV